MAGRPRELLSRNEEEELRNKKCPRFSELASASQHPETQKEKQAGYSSERTVEGQ